MKINERGVSSVEFALVLPVLLLILFGIVEYGWVMINQIVLTNAVSVGARTGIKASEGEEETDARAATINSFWIGVLESGDVTINFPEDDPRRIEVQVTGWTYTTLTGFLPSTMVPDALKAEAVMVFP